MILTDYYLLKELKQLKSHRFDVVATTGGYPPFEEIANRSKGGRFFCYYNGVPETFSPNAQRKADRAITNTKNISSVFIPDLTNPLIGYGDTKGTADALLFLFSEDYKQLEIVVARGYRNNARNLYNLLSDGGLEDELAVLRTRALFVPSLPK